MEKVRRKAVTMEDVAKEAGVSVTTVSHVINQTASITRETCDRVREAIAHLGYVPRSSSDTHRGQRLLAVVSPEASAEFYVRAMQGICSAAWEQNYAVIHFPMQSRYQTGDHQLSALLQIGAKGVIFLGGGPDSDQQVLQIAKRLPIVLGDRQLPEAEADTVSADNIDTMRQMVNRLARAGYTRMGYVAEDQATTCAAERYRGFKLGMAENRLRMDERWVFQLPELRENKTENAYRLFAGVDPTTLPQIFLCSSDLIAVGVMRALKDQGVKVPGNVGVVGFDDLSLSAYTEPAMTTVYQDMEQLGRLCVQTLLERMDKKNRPIRSLTIRTKAVIRDSVRL